MSELACISLGSNLGDRSRHLAAGLAQLCQPPAIDWVRCSGVYETAPVGRTDQPPFLNAVALVRTALAPLALLHAMQQIERLHHRQRHLRWGPRTLDLDLLLYGRRCHDGEELILPHPHMLGRAFVLVPLLELVPDLHHPGTGLPLVDHVQRLGPGQSARRLGDFPPMETEPLPCPPPSPS